MSKTRSTTKFKFTEGERVLCFEPDPTKARVLYDAKILETRIKKDGKGRKLVEYLIHFQGWNSSWDRYVAENFILQDNEEHRLLQKELADTARTILKENRKKKQRIGAGLRGADPKLKLDSDSSSVDDGDSATRSSFEEDVPDIDETAESVENAECLVAEPISLNIPEGVKHFLEEDCIQICHKRKIVELPSKINTVAILEGFVRHFAHSLVQKQTTKSRVTHRSNSCSSTSGSISGELITATTQLSLCKEYVDGIRISFDSLLDITLLYPEERTQLAQLKEESDHHKSEQQNEDHGVVVSSEHPHIHDAYRWRVLPCVPNQKQFLPSLIYGVTHLSRMLGNFGFHTFNDHFSTVQSTDYSIFRNSETSRCRTENAFDRGKKETSCRLHRQAITVTKVFNILKKEQIKSPVIRYIDKENNLLSHVQYIRVN